MRDRTGRAILFGLAIACCIMLSAEGLRAALRIEPAYVQLSLDKGRPTGSFLISNLSDTEERYRINAIHFVTTPDGGTGQGKKDAPHSIANWLKFNPKEFTLKPNSKRAIRFVVVPRGKITDGEYWAALELESLKKDSSEVTDEAGRSLKIGIIHTMVVPIFAIKGKVTHSAEVNDVTVVARPDGPYLQGTLVNTGTARIKPKGHYVILGADGQLVQEGDTGVLRTTRGAYQRFSKKLDPNMPKGSYSVVMTFQGELVKKPIEVETEVDWTNTPPPAPPATAESGQTPAAPPKPPGQAPEAVVPAKSPAPDAATKPVTQPPKQPAATKP